VITLMSQCWGTPSEVFAKYESHEYGGSHRWNTCTNAKSDSTSASDPKEHIMSTFLAQDGTRLFYRDWGTGQPVVFSHAWPASADEWDPQMFFFASEGFRAIAFDRRGHGRSEQTWHGNDIDTYAGDLAALLETLDLKETILVGHSTGGGEVARYVGRYGLGRVAKIVFLASITPGMLRSDTNPDGLPMEAFDAARATLLKNRSQAYQDATLTFYNFDQPGAEISKGTQDKYWFQGMQGSLKAHYDCIKAYSEPDFTDDLKRIDVPTLVMHSEDDEGVPYHFTGARSAKIIKNAQLKTYKGLSHGMAETHPDLINADLLAFFRS
jgi:non-heme chloroperoxidase